MIYILKKQAVSLFCCDAKRFGSGYKSNNISFNFKQFRLKFQHKYFVDYDMIEDSY